MAQSQVATIPALAAASATAVCASQTPSGAGSLIINGSSASGGVATFAAARRVLFTTVSDESAKTFTVIGKDRVGNFQSETLAGPNAASGYTAQDYLSITSIVVSAALTGAVTVGTNGVASSKWIVCDYNRHVFSLSAAISFASQTGSIAVEVTLDNVQRALTESQPGGSGDMSATGVKYATYVLPLVLTFGSAVTANALFNVAQPVKAVRITATVSGATTAPFTFTALQAGI